MTQPARSEGKPRLGAAKRRMPAPRFPIVDRSMSKPGGSRARMNPGPAFDWGAWTQ